MGFFFTWHIFRYSILDLNSKLYQLLFAIHLYSDISTGKLIKNIPIVFVKLLSKLFFLSYYAMHKWKAPPDFISLVLCPWTVMPTHLGDTHEWLCQIGQHGLFNANEQMCHARQTYLGDTHDGCAMEDKLTLVTPMNGCTMEDKLPIIDNHEWQVKLSNVSSL